MTPEIADTAVTATAPDVERLPDDHVLVIGAGPAGLAVGGALAERGRGSLLLEASERSGAAWSRRYAALCLNTTRRFSGLPGLPIPRTAGRYPSAASYLAYLDAYAAHFALAVRTETRVRSIALSDAVGWRVTTSDGAVEARTVVIATGHDAVPFTPPWPGREEYVRPLDHASAYRDAVPYRGLDVLVVGAGNSGADIAVDLAEGGARRVRLAVRRPPQICPRLFHGVPMQYLAIALERAPARVGDRVAASARRRMLGDLRDRGLPTPSEGLSTQFRTTGVVPIIDRGFAAAVSRGAIDVVPAVAGFNEVEVLLEGGERISPDAVVAATGYRTGLEALVADSSVLDDDGRPLRHAPDHLPGAPGLFAVGYRNPLAGNLRDIARQARELAGALVGART